MHACINHNTPCVHGRPSVQSIHLAVPVRGPRGYWRHLAEATAAYLPRLRGLHHLSLHLPLTSDTAHVSGALLTLARTLTSATLRGLYLAADDMHAFACGHWQQCPVTHLTLPDAAGSAAGLQLFCSGLRLCARLEVLEMPLRRGAGRAQWSGMHEFEATELLAERLPKLTRLRRLDASGWRLAPVASRHSAVDLWRQGWHPGLTALALADTGFDDGWAGVLADALDDMHALAVLDLRGNRLTAAGVRPLVRSLRKTNSLQELRLGGTLVDEAAAVELSRGLCAGVPGVAAASPGCGGRGAPGSPTAASDWSEGTRVSPRSPVRWHGNGPVHGQHACAPGRFGQLCVLDVGGVAVTAAAVAAVWRTAEQLPGLREVVWPELADLDELSGAAVAVDGLLQLVADAMFALATWRPLLRVCAGRGSEADQAYMHGDEE